MLSKFVIAFLSRSKHLLISWLENRDQSPCHRREQEPKNAAHWVPQVAQAITPEKADHSLFIYRGKDQPGCCSGSGPLFLLPHSLCRREWEGPKSPLVDPEKKHHDLPLVGLRIGPGDGL